MADQDFSELLDDGKPNQISVGLVETTSRRMISYLIDPNKIGNALACLNEQDPDYLPLVGLRTRRLGEQYPYPAIQGYRAGNEVEVRCYMLAKNKPLPPPARVIAYMQPKSREAIDAVLSVAITGPAFFMQHDDHRANPGQNGNVPSISYPTDFNGLIDTDVLIQLIETLIDAETVRLRYEISNVGNTTWANPRYLAWFEPIVDPDYIGALPNGDSGYTSFGEDAGRFGSQSAPTITPYNATGRILTSSIISADATLKRHCHYSDSNAFLAHADYAVAESADWNVDLSFTHNEVGLLWRSADHPPGVTRVFEYDINTRNKT